MRTALSAVLSAATVLLSGLPSLAYTPQWLECTGEQVITTDGGATRQPVVDIYVFDQDARNLFRYSVSQKHLSMVGAQPSDKVLSWSGTGSGVPASHWAGQLDLGSMSLRLTYENGAEKRAWVQSCKPTDPRPEA